MQLPLLLHSWPPIWKELYEERAGIMEVLGGLERKEAERLAEKDIREVAKKER